MELKQRVADVAQVTLVTFSRARWGRYTIRYYNKNNISRASCAGGATPHHPVPQARDTPPHLRRGALEPTSFLNEEGSLNKYSPPQMRKGAPRSACGGARRAGWYFLLLLRQKFNRLHQRPGIRIVVVVQKGRRGACLHIQSWPEGETEFHSAGTRPDVEHNAVRQNIVVIHFVAVLAHGSVEGGAVSAALGSRVYFRNFQEA